jgi:hypothetical protein
MSSGISARKRLRKAAHLEKLCLLGDGVGRDHLSDFTTNLIKGYLLEYTQVFAREHVRPEFRRRFAVAKVHFDYEMRRWRGGEYDLPSFGGEFVLLTPKDILTKDEAWINRSDLLDRFEDIYGSATDDQLRAQVGDYLLRRLSEDASQKERRAVIAAAVENFPGVLDYYIKEKEETGDEAHIMSELKVRETEIQFGENVRELVGTYLVGVLGDPAAATIAESECLCRAIRTLDQRRMPRSRDLRWAGVVTLCHRRIHGPLSHRARS